MAGRPSEAMWRDGLASVAWAGRGCDACVKSEPRVEACILAAAERSRRKPSTRATGSSVGVEREARGKALYARSGLPTNFGFFAASAGGRGMRARQESTHFPSADA